jgi:hypothetical protein
MVYFSGEMSEMPKAHGQTSAGRVNRDAGAYATPGGKSYLEHLLSLNPSEKTRAAIERVKEQDREAGRTDKP